jgi:sodium-dependent dicarboxylate transporter 2/3/5
MVWLGFHLGWAREAAYMGGILVLAAVWWVTEAIPLFVTSLVILALEILLFANPGNWPGLGFASGPSPTMAGLIAAAADSILLLFFGGLILARACVNEGVDRVLSSVLLRPFGNRPAFVLLGVLVVTAFLSMWMSNTATAALMMTLVGPLAQRLAPKDAFRTALFLAVPVGANLGGMGTPIASPPNAIAMKYLASNDLAIGFGPWMLVAVPMLTLILLCAWGLLWRWYPCQAVQVDLFTEPAVLSPRGRVVLWTFAGTVILWLTESLHGLPAAYVGLMPALVLTATAMVRREDVQQLDWSVLILISGGIVLGAGMQMTGLDRIVVGYLPLDGDTSVGMLVFALTVLAMALAVFMSNTAAANLIIPVAMASVVTLNATDGEATFLTTYLAMAISLAVGSAMLLPSSTPPNAIAYASGEFTTNDLLRIGACVAAVTLVLTLFALGKLVGLVFG